uniref:Uncharacterized protein n=1 Tax=Arundo donax TaxID=35708 RepID=A0A0A8ZGM4_ARUDO
MYSRLAVH